MDKYDYQLFEQFGVGQAGSLNSLLECISTILEEILQETDTLEPTRTIFHAPKQPTISLSNYMQRLGKYCGCSEECYILALIYLDRLQEMNQEIVINSLCVHRFLITAILVAIKYQDDEYYKNEFYAKVGGISRAELNTLESEFLRMIDFRVYITWEEFVNYREKLGKYSEAE